MSINTDNTARIIVFALCICIVIMRLLDPSIAFDACSLGALALAALIALAPAVRIGRARASSVPSAHDVDELISKAESAGLLMGESKGAYAALNATRPMALALAGARATLSLRLKALVDQARLDSHGAEAESCLGALNTAGVTTDAQHAALTELMRMLSCEDAHESPAAASLLETTIRIIEMLDGTLE